MLIVLDRSGSMRRCVDSDSRWNIARDAIESVLDANSDKIRFGLSTYPYYCPGSTKCGVLACDDTCSDDCDWNAVCNPAIQVVCDLYPPCEWDPSAGGGAGLCVPRDAGIATGNNAVPGDVDVPVGDEPEEILDTLAPPTGSRGPQHPGGYTPTGRTLRNIASRLDAFGLPDPNDDTARDNYILLLTDGAANSDGGTYGVCDGDLPGFDDTIARINCTLDALRAEDPPVRTFAVGFIEMYPQAMNCHAVHGGTSRCGTPDECAAIVEAGECTARLGCTWSGTCGGGVDADNCDSASEECYYRANNAQELTDAFETIAGEIASCNYVLDQVPLDSNDLSVYFNFGCVGIDNPDKCNTTPTCAWAAGACQGDPLRLERDRSRVDNWDYEPITNQILFAGSACESVKEALVTPIVILGCSSSGG
jgi:hypothetical protein